MPGARCTRSLVCSVLVAHECSHHGRTGITRHSRTRMVLTAYFVVSPVIGLSCHRRQRIKGFAGPGRARKTSADLTPASRRQDHTTSPSASASFVCAPGDRSRETRPAIHFARRHCRVHRIPSQRP